MQIALDYMITARCNLKCPFCYGPDPEMPAELNRNEKFALLEGIAAQSIKYIVIAGGEPLISPDIEAVLDCARSLEMRIAMQTNAFALERLSLAAGRLDWLAVPVDGVATATQELMRTSAAQTKQSIAAIRIARSFNPKIRVKIGTVLTKYNLMEINDIHDCVRQIKPDVWKIYQLRP